MLPWLRALANAILGGTGKPDRLGTATRMAIDADHPSDCGASPTRGHEQAADVDPIDELMRIVEKADGPPPHKAHSTIISSRRRPSKGRR